LLLAAILAGSKRR